MTGTIVTNWGRVPTGQIRPLYSQEFTPIQMEEPFFDLTFDDDLKPSAYGFVPFAPYGGFSLSYSTGGIYYMAGMNLFGWFYDITGIHSDTNWVLRWDGFSVSFPNAAIYISIGSEEGEEDEQETVVVTFATNINEGYPSFGSARIEKIVGQYTYYFNDELVTETDSRFKVGTWNLHNSGYVSIPYDHVAFYWGNINYIPGNWVNTDGVSLWVS